MTNKPFRVTTKKKDKRSQRTARMITEIINSPKYRDKIHDAVAKAILGVWAQEWLDDKK